MSAAIRKAARLAAEGAAQHQAGRLDRAEKLYRQSLALDPANIDALHLTGVILRARGDLDGAVRMISESLRHHPRQHGALSNLGAILIQQERHNAAVDVLRQAIALAPDLQPAHINLGLALTRSHRFDEAAAAFAEAIRRFPGNANLRTHYAALLIKAGREPAARTELAALRDMPPQGLPGLRQRANVLADLMCHAEAADYLHQVYCQDPGALDALAAACHEFAMACDWRQRASLQAELLAQLAAPAAGDDARRPAVLPFHLLAILDAPELHLQVARRHATSLTPPALPAGTAARTTASGRRLRIGYLSADFHAHATAFLIAGVLEHHDRARYEVFAYSTGPDDKSATRERLRLACEHFIDLAGADNAAIAQAIAADAIDILLDLKGHTQDSRSAVLLARPAPLQLNYLGYPGSMGMDGVDYILADPIVVPDDQRIHYSEKVLRLPVCYQPNDDRRQTAATPTRAAAGLPADGLVLCCFNRTYKYSPEIFAVWCRALQAAADSVLWLLTPGDEVSANLRREAGQRGIAPERLVFADPLPAPQHWARIALADLFLDTFPYGAHTTASDALWMGVPVLTLAGNSFASRVAASLLSAVGLPELAAPDLAAYERTLLRLLADAAWRTQLHRCLAEHGRQSPLFQTARYTRELEAAYDAIWRRHAAGLAPEHFDVPANPQASVNR